MKPLLPDSGSPSSPSSPTIHPDHIHPGETMQTPPVATRDSAPGAFAVSPNSQDLHGILEQFDPLSIGAPAKSTGDFVPSRVSKSLTETPAKASAELHDSSVDVDKQVSGDLAPSQSQQDESSDKLSSQQNVEPPKPAEAAADSSESTNPSSSSTKPTTPAQNPEKTQPNAPPQPSDEETRPFDFQRFLDQLRHKSADPIARYVKSFLNEFNKRPWTTSEQVKIISDFKAFIAVKMTMCPPFSTLSDHGMTNALEGMEKLIMNRLYTKTLSSEIPIAERDASHEEDVLRDTVLAEKMRIWHWIEGRHLDLADRFLQNGEAFVKLASDELTKITHYRAPRDKVICILNCCKVIFGLLRQTDSEQSADGFLPILIYVVIKAQPKDLISNVNYIQRFRNPDMLNGEAGYYLSSLSGAISFIETLDRSALSISDEEFETNVENSVRSIAEPASSLDVPISNSPPRTPDREGSPAPQSTTVDPSRSGTPQPLNASAVLYQSAGMLAAPFKSLSKMFEADPAAADSTTSAGEDDKGATKSHKEPQISPEESAARQASAEEHEARRIYQDEFKKVSQTLNQMFPTLDQDVIQDVLRETQGRVGAAVDVCLSLLDN